MKITIVAAMARNRTIGDKGAIPWMGKFPEDMRHFRNLTQGSGKAVLMGRKTWESIGSKPLPGRFNFVLTRDTANVVKLCFDENENCVYDNKSPVFVMNDIQRIVDTARNYGMMDLFIIGGEQVYHEALKFADEIVLTVIERSFGGDAKFPIIDQKDYHCWGVESGENEAFSYHFEYHRRNIRE
jgi:dihydrofolate reductase